MKVLHHRNRVEAAGGLVLAVAFDEPERVRAGLLSGVDDPWPVLQPPAAPLTAQSERNAAAAG